MNSTELRQRFIKYYEEMGYQALPQAPLLDPSIPMSFVMSAGLVQIEKSLSLLQSKMPGDKYVLVQDCFRHFDIEKVGKDDTHLSFFAMPGAFVFGEIEAKETVRLMWNLATQIMEIDPKNLWVTYFGGDFILDRFLPEHHSVRNAWLETGMPAKRIIALDNKHNFWIQGEGFQTKSSVRKCGPNTELFFDRGIEHACNPNCKPGCPCGRFVEFSNSLFIRYELNKNDDTIVTSKTPFTETVIGIERTAMIMENSQSVFDSTIYRPIIKKIRPYISMSGQKVQSTLTGERIVADHLRALYRLVEDGAPPPGKDGRQRIVKILIRRIITQEIVLHIYSSDFVPILIDCIASLTPSKEDSTTTKRKILAYYFSEKERFTRTLERGYKQIDRLLYLNNSIMLSEHQIGELKRDWGMPEILTRSFLASKQQAIFEHFTFIPEGINR